MHASRISVLSVVGTFFVLSIAFAPGNLALASCPAPENFQGAIENVLRKGVKVEEVNDSLIEGVCEVRVQANGQNRIFYTDDEGKYLLGGPMIEIATKKNFTKEKLEALMVLTPEQRKKLDELTAFSTGTGDKAVYYATDPMCPYCKRGEQALQEMVDAGEITVHYLMYPLPMHQGAKEQCVALICDEKGLEEFHKGYKSENQCEAGKKKVEDTMALMSQVGVRGTPAYIFADGAYRVGVMPDQVVREMLGLPEKELQKKAEAGKAPTVTVQPAKPRKAEPEKAAPAEKAPEPEPTAEERTTE